MSTKQKPKKEEVQTHTLRIPDAIKLIVESMLHVIFSTLSLLVDSSSSTAAVSSHFKLQRPNIRQSSIDIQRSGATKGGPRTSGPSSPSCTAR